MPIIVPSPVRYVDASYFQAVIDVNAYKAAGFTRIAHRATYRDSGTDSSFIGRWPTFSGITRQAYQFAYDGDDPTKAAQHFLNVVDSAGGFRSGDEAMLDLEWFQAGDGSWVGLNPIHGKAYAQTFLSIVAAAYSDVRLFMYGNAWWFEQAGITEADFPNVGMITAAYGASFRTPADWSHSCIWQYTDRQIVPGFPGELVDFNQITCPTNLDHLSIGDDNMSQADIDAINTHVDNAMRFWFTNLIGTRQQPAGIDPKTPTSLASLADGLYVSYHGIKDDPTHPGQVDLHSQLSAVMSAVQAVEARVANITQTGGAVDPQLAADIQNLIAALNGGLSWTVTTKAGS